MDTVHKTKQRGRYGSNTSLVVDLPIVERVCMRPQRNFEDTGLIYAEEGPTFTHNEDMKAQGGASWRVRVFDPHLRHSLLNLGLHD